MTVPNGPKPASGWPAIIFNHGYHPARAVSHHRALRGLRRDAIARNGYIVFKSDYRGHGSSEGPPEGAYGTPGYTDDVLNALASVKAYKDADPNRIGMWGHSMGGQLTLRCMVVSKDIKAGVIWGGVVAPYPNIFARVTDPATTDATPPNACPARRSWPYGRPWRQELTDEVRHAGAEPGVLGVDLAQQLPGRHLRAAAIAPQRDGRRGAGGSLEDARTRRCRPPGKPVELYTYPGDNHNINGNFVTAMQRTIAFFDKYVKGS